MSEGGGSKEATERGRSTALEVFKLTVLADMQRKFASAQDSRPREAAWGQGLSPQILDAAVLNMWREATADTKSFFQHAADKKNKWERERTASPRDDGGQADASGGEHDEGVSDHETNRADDDSGRSQPGEHVRVDTNKVRNDSTTREDITDSINNAETCATGGGGSDGGGGRRASIHSSVDHGEIQHHTITNHIDDDDMGLDTDDGGGETGTIMPPTAMVTRSRVSDEAQAKGSGRPKEETKPQCRRLTTNQAGDDDGMTKRFRSSDEEAQAKNTSRSDEKLKARKSAPDDPGVISRDHTGKSQPRLNCLVRLSRVPILPMFPAVLAATTAKGVERRPRGVVGVPD
eukprot:g1659.t2